MAKHASISAEDTIAAACMSVRLRMLNRAVTGIYDDALRPFGVRSGQLSILVMTAQKGTARPAEVSRELLLDPSTLSRNLERMRAKGWLQDVEGDDGRSQPFRLTKKGRALLDRVLPAWQKAQAEVETLLGSRACSTIGRAAKDLSISRETV